MPVAIQFADQALAVFRRLLGQRVYERLDQLTASLAEFLSAAEVCGIAFDQRWIELMVADQQTQTIAKARLAVTRAIPTRRRRCEILLGRSFKARVKVSKLFHRAQADAVGFTQGPIDGAGLSDAHLRATDEGRNI